MAKTRSMTRNQNHVDTPTKKRSKTIPKGYSSPWSDLNHDVLFLVMMQLGVVDFLAFSGVCKLWRELGLSNKNTFMASRAPMLISISDDLNEKECCLEYFEGGKYKTLLPLPGDWECVGITCGYLVLFGRKTRDFWLVNPITRNELHFPAFPSASHSTPYTAKAILVFSPILSACVFVMINIFSPGVWFSIAGRDSWNHVSSTYYINELIVFKGRIYTISVVATHLYELRLFPDPKLVLLYETRTSLMPFSEFVSLGENLYVVDTLSKKTFNFHELDFGKKEWVVCEKIKEEFAIFINRLGRYITAIKPESWA